MSETVTQVNETTQQIVRSILLRELLCELLESTSRGGFSETKRTANMFSRWIFDTFSRVLTMMS